MNRELILHQLLQEVYTKTAVPVYDYIAVTWPGEASVFAASKSLSDQLVCEKLAIYSDEQRTELTITNFGRFWILKGGYEVFLKENEHRAKEHHHHNGEQAPEHALKEDLRLARLRFTRYRIITYWWSFGLSLISFVLSLLSLYLILSGRK